MYVHERYDDFVRAGELAADIAEQNARLGRVAAEIDEEDFQVMAQDGIAADQSDTFNQLASLSSSLPYGELNDDGELLAMELDDATERLASITDEEDAQKTHFLELAKKVAELAPRREQDARRLAAERIAHIDSLNRDALQERIAAVEADIASYNQFYETVGAAWPIPLAIDPTAQPSRFFVDEIPLTPAVHGTSSPRLKRIKEHNIDEPEASQLIAFFLAEKTGEVVTVDDLISFLYGDVAELRQGIDLRSRITTTLGPMVQGKRIVNMLTEEGFSLLYGYRTQIERTTAGRERQISRKRIYEAVPLGEVDETEVNQTVTSVVDDRGNVVDTITETISGKPIDLNHEKSDSGAPALSLKKNDTESNGKLVVEPKDPENLADRDRLQQFDDAVKAAVSYLHECGLMSEQPLAVSFVRERSTRSVLGNDVVLDRLLAAKIISREERYEGLLSPVQLVAAHLFSTHRNIFDTKRSSRRALKIIEKRVSDFMREQQRQMVAEIA